MEHQETNKLIKKANELVESRYKFDIWETRVFAKMITLINKDDEDFKTYRIYIKELQEDFQLTKNKDAYSRLKDGARRLMQRIVQITYNTEEGQKVLETPVIIGLETLKAGKSFIDVSFHPNMRPFLLQLKSQFLMYDIRNILKISSVHSIRIYELLKQYEKIGHRTFLVEELKDILQVSDKYPLYANFKQRIIKKAQKDLQKNTDICFTYEEIKKVRSVEKIKFFITKNPGNDKKDITNLSKIIEQEADSVVAEQQRIIELLQNEGIKEKSTLDKLFKEYRLEYIDATLKKCQRYFSQHKGKVKNKAGYILNALKDAYYKQEIVKDAQELVKKKQKDEKEVLIQEQKDRVEEAKKVFHKSYSKRLKDLRNEHLNDDLLEEILEKKKNTPLYGIVKKALEKRETSKILETWINDFLAEKYLSEVERDFGLFFKKYTNQ